MNRAEPRPEYTFGDTPLAAERLQLVAEVFEAPSRAFLHESVTARPRVALDLGCGPGATTRLVSTVTGAEHTVGLDTSAAFLELAARDAPANISFVPHDATRVPLPRAPVDFIYCRLLLAHFPDVGAAVTTWIGELTVGGRLLIDEVEWIGTDHPVLAAYERVVVDLVASRGAPMYAGPIVNELRAGPGWEARSSRVREVPVATADAARVFGMNLVTWRDDRHIRESYDASEIDALGRDLDALTSASDTGAISWGIRQIAFERTSPS